MCGRPLRCTRRGDTGCCAAQYAGADRQADGNHLTLAVSSRLIRESDGHERLSASLGQIRYFEESRVTVPGEQPIDEAKSAWVADMTFAPNDRWTVGGSYQWNPKEGRRDLASVRARYLIGDTGVLNLRYRYRRDLLEQADLSFLYPINRNWSLVGRYYYSIQDRQLLEGIAGVQWEQLRAVTPRDAYAVANGYSARAQLQAITFDRNRGEISRVKVNP